MTMLLVCLAVPSAAHAGMLGAPVTSILHTAFAGSWKNSSATVAPGAEFTQTYFAGNSNVVIYLDISDLSFTLTFSNNIVPIPGNDGTFNLGLEGFEFTAPNQRFVAVTLAGSTGGFPTNSLTSTILTPTTIHIVMNEPMIPGATTWTATWNVTLSPRLSIALSGGNVDLSWPADAASSTLQRHSNVVANEWVDIVTNATHMSLSATNAAQFFRLFKY